MKASTSAPTKTASVRRPSRSGHSLPNAFRRRGLCQSRCARVMVLMVALGREPCSAATGAYCKAAPKLPEKFIRRLTYQVGNGVEDQAPAQWRWHNRRTMLVDGAETHRGRYARRIKRSIRNRPPNGQDWAFPSSGLCVLLAFATAVVSGAAFGPYEGKETGETALFRQLLDQVRAGDIVVADRYYCSYFMIALLQQRGVDAAFRLHHKRQYDFRRGERLGHDDHIVAWQRPQRPTGWTRRPMHRCPKP